MSINNRVTKQMIQYIESFTINGESPLTAYPKVLPDGRSLIILKCVNCRYYSYKATTKINNSDEVLSEWVSKQKCKSCSATERFCKKHDPDYGKPDVVDVVDESDDELYMGMTKAEYWVFKHSDH